MFAHMTARSLTRRNGAPWLAAAMALTAGAVLVGCSSNPAARPRPTLVTPSPQAAVITGPNLVEVTTAPASTVAGPGQGAQPPAPAGPCQRLTPAMVPDSVITDPAVAGWIDQLYQQAPPQLNKVGAVTLTLPQGMLSCVTYRNSESFEVVRGALIDNATAGAGLAKQVGMDVSATAVSDLGDGAVLVQAVMRQGISMRQLYVASGSQVSVVSLAMRREGADDPAQDLATVRRVAAELHRQ